MEDKLSNIRLFVLDVDGVLTDGSLLITESGKYLRRMNIKDGYALRYASQQGYQLAIISGAEQALMKDRFDKLGFKNVFVGVKNKLEAYNELKAKLNVSDDEVLFMGDDMLDVNLLEVVGFSCCPSDACDDVKEIVDFISSKQGGHGCVREIIERILKLHGKWH